MLQIGLLSDTHGYLPDRIKEFLSSCDEIWHAGDIGSLQVLKSLQAIKPVRAVYGNIDGPGIRAQIPENQRFYAEKVDVWMTHIGGYPGKYDKQVRETIQQKPPKLFITGHSHILKVMPDKQLNLLHINPGAAGKAGFHKKRTAVSFIIDKEDIRDLQVFEMPR